MPLVSHASPERQLRLRIQNTHQKPDMTEQGMCCDAALKQGNRHAFPRGNAEDIKLTTVVLSQVQDWRGLQFESCQPKSK